MFGFGKKKKVEKKAAACCCNCGGSNETTNKNISECYGKAVNGICCIKVLGAGCQTCHKQYENTKDAVKNMGLDIEIEYITDMEKVMQYGAMSMPVLVVNEKVVSQGKLLGEKEVIKLLGGIING